MLLIPITDIPDLKCLLTNLTRKPKSPAIPPFNVLTEQKTLDSKLQKHSKRPLIKIANFNSANPLKIHTSRMQT